MTERFAAHDAPVVVVGAGPAGLAAAISLARLGVETMLVERRPSSSSLPRATAGEPALDGAAAPLGPRGRDARGRGRRRVAACWQCGHPGRRRPRDGVARRPADARAGRAQPDGARVRPPGPPGARAARAPASLAGARVRLHTEMVGVETGPGRRGDAPRLATRRGPDRPRPVPRGRGRRAQPVRARARHRHAGPRRLGQAVTALFRAPLWAVLGGHRYGIYASATRTAPAAFLPAGRGDRWVLRHLGSRRRSGGTPTDSLVADPRGRRRRRPRRLDRAHRRLHVRRPARPTASGPATSSWPATPPTA